MRRFMFAVAVCLISFSFLAAVEPCVSGLQPGQKPGPYASLVAVGPQRGQSHCFICETANRPAVIVFARHMNEPLGSLLSQLDQAPVKHRAVELRAWATFLSDDQPTLEPKLVEWSRKLGLANLSVAVFEDRNGPPSYRLNEDAEVTVLLSINQKVAGNFAFRAGELTDEKVKEVMNALPRILNPK